MVREGLSQRVQFMSDAYWEAFFAEDSGKVTMLCLLLVGNVGDGGIKIHKLKASIE